MGQRRKIEHGALINLITETRTVRRKKH